MELMERRRLLNQTEVKNLIPEDDPSDPMKYYTHSSTGSVKYSANENAYYSYGRGVGYSKHALVTNRLFIAPEDMNIKFSVWYKDIGTSYGLRFYKNGTRMFDIRDAGSGVWKKYNYTTRLSKDEYLSIMFYEYILWRDLRIIKV